MPLRLGVIAYAPIQYHVPLWRKLAARGNIGLDVLYLSDRGYSPVVDPGFGQSISWDIDLLSGYSHRFMSTAAHPRHFGRKALSLGQWISGHDVVVVNGYTNPWMLAAMSICKTRGIPYLLRASSHPRGPSTGMRRHIRHAVVSKIVHESAGGLAMGRINEQFYQEYDARNIFFAPNSVDDAYFASSPGISRPQLLKKLGLTDRKPVVIYCGKLINRKRPLDLVAALQCLPTPVTTIFVGDGPLASEIRSRINPETAVVTGFVNQSELPAYYHAADILVLPSQTETWGLVINEAMAAGTLPVVSDHVGAAPDLVEGLGEVYACGDIMGLAAALGRAQRKVGESNIRDMVRSHAGRYSLDHTAAGFEHGALSVGIKLPHVSR